MNYPGHRLSEVQTLAIQRHDGPKEDVMVERMIQRLTEAQRREVLNRLLARAIAAEAKGTEASRRADAVLGRFSVLADVQ